MRAVLLDGYTINPGDLSWNSLRSLCSEFTAYDMTPDNLIVPHIGSSDIVFTSKKQITRAVME